MPIGALAPYLAFKPHSRFDLAAHGLVRVAGVVHRPRIAKRFDEDVADHLSHLSDRCWKH